MSFWVLLQILVNLVLLAGLVAVWVRLSRPQKDDPRLSKGLQLLQSKIAVLEDLSDRTEVQVQQLTALMEQKVREIQDRIHAADKHMQKLEESRQKSMEVAKIFQDRIPHTEILERQNTIKYVKAAKMAHQGMSVDEIASQVDLSRGEIEFIAKVNREQLMFCEDSLPEWANEEPANQEEAVPTAEMAHVQLQDLSKAFEVPKTDQDALKKLGEAFKAACDQTTSTQVSASGNPSVSVNSFGNPKAQVANRTITKTIDAGIRPVEFRRIELTKDLG